MKALVFNDQPMLHMALSLVLEGSNAEIVHVKDQEALERLLDGDVACVIVDLETKGLDLPRLDARLAKNAPKSGLVLIGAAKPEVKVARVLWTAEPYSDRDRIIELVNRCAGEVI